MTRQETLKWFEEILNARPKEKRSSSESVSLGAPDFYCDRKEATEWITTAHAALDSVFPRQHAIALQLSNVLAPVGGQPPDLGDPDVVDGVMAVMSAASKMIADGRLQSLVDGVRAEAVTDVLDQADDLLRGSHAVAACVLAGGALEMHLRHLCESNNLTWDGHGTISKYDGAIGQHRKQGAEIYPKGDSKSVTVWADYRNDAAHNPGGFQRTNDEVRLMIQGIRQFLSKTS